MKAVKKVLSIILRIGISIAFLYLVLRQIDKKSFLEIIKHTDKPLLLLTFIASFFNYAFCLWRWQILLKAAKLNLPFKRIFISNAGGIFFNLFLPSTIGGDLVRSVDLAVHTKRPKEIVATVLLDRLSGFIGLVIVALLAVIFGWNFIDEKKFLIPVGILSLLLVIVLLVLFNKFLFNKINRFLHSPDAGKIREAIKNLHQEIHVFRQRKKVAAVNITLSVLIQLLGPLTFYILGLALGINIHIAYFFIFVPIIGAITLLPISIGGLGLRDAATVFFFAQAGVGKDLAFAMSLLSFVIILIYGAIGGVIYALTIHHRRIQYNSPPGHHKKAS